MEEYMGLNIVHFINGCQTMTNRN